MSGHESAEPIDHSPKSPEEITFFSKADNVYAFMQAVYPIYGRMRFRGAPFMVEPEEEMKRPGQESVSDHMWAATLFLRVTLPILPNVAGAIDGNTVKKFIEVHDIGEIEHGDISAVLQLQGVGKNKDSREMDVYKSLISLLPEESQEDLMQLVIYEEEKADPETENKEVLLAKIFDMIQGDHFVLTNSIHFQEYGDMHRSIITTKFIPYAKRLEVLFRAEHNEAAAREVSLLMHHHLYQYQSGGVFIPY